MKCPRWIRRWIFREKPLAILDRQVTKNPLREFIYLDEVSLQSLLSSKNGEMTSTTSTEVTQSVEAESRTSTSITASGFGKAEAGSRFQTKNSSTLQTAKKATVQSWFRELDKIPNLRLVETVQQVQSFTINSELVACDNRSVCIREDEILRGHVVEFRVRLAADPIFHLVTIVSEMKAMAEDYPTMMTGNGGLEQFQELEGISRVLQRLLAGLVPVRAQIIDYVVVELDGNNYVAHVDAIRGLKIDHKPLEIGCVTELDAYWKDIRRVLFSNAEFTMLCRVAKNGLSETWSPVRLADLLGQLAPNLSKQIDDAARIMFDAARHDAPSEAKDTAFRGVLEHYANGFSAEVERDFCESDQFEIQREIARLASAGKSTTEQVGALKQFDKFLSGLSGQAIEPDKAVELRRMARDSAESSRVDATTIASSAAPDDHGSPNKGETFLDVEVVAMYW